jgi:hypothetical protein
MICLKSFIKSKLPSSISASEAGWRIVHGSVVDAGLTPPLALQVSGHGSKPN